MAVGDIETHYEDGQWKSRAQGKSRAFGVGGTKEDQQGTARARAVRGGVVHVIKNKDGKISEKNTYPRARDKNPPRVTPQTKATQDCPCAPARITLLRWTRGLSRRMDSARDAPLPPDS